MDSFFLSQGYCHCNSDPNVDMLRDIGSLLLIVIYVDVLLIIGISISSIDNEIYIA